jgi:hypothetical protein
MIEILINKRKWLISGLYRPQSINDNNFNKDFIDTFDKISTLYDNVLILGDINYDMLSEKVDRFVKITSLRVAGAPLVKQVGLLTRFTKSKISHTFFSGAPLCSESMS